MATLASNEKKLKIRAFIIENHEINQSESKLKELLTTKVQQTKVKDRKMRLNDDDPYKEEDLISDYTIGYGDNLGGAILRIMDSAEVPSIPDELFDEDKLTIEELNNLDIPTSKIYKQHYYFMMSGKYFVTTLPGNITIKTIETYLNWFLSRERGETIFELTPKMVMPQNVSIKELQSIRITDPKNVSTENVSSGDGETVGKRKLGKIATELALSLFKDADDISDIELERVISAELFIKFKKPKEMKKEEFQKVLGAYMKPISDTENVTFNTKDGRPPIKSSEITKIKEVVVELTTSRKISEPSLYLEMEKFINELQNEEVA